MPELMYYDIFKNYYANTQEEKAYYIMPNEDVEYVNIDGQRYNPNNINISFDNLEGKEMEIGVGPEVTDIYGVRINIIDKAGMKINAYANTIGTATYSTGLITISMKNVNIFNKLINVESALWIGCVKVSIRLSTC